MAFKFPRVSPLGKVKEDISIAINSLLKLVVEYGNDGNNINQMKAACISLESIDQGLGLLLISENDRYVQMKVDLLQTLKQYENEIPSEFTFYRMLAPLDGFVATIGVYLGIGKLYTDSYLRLQHQSSNKEFLLGHFLFTHRIYAKYSMKTVNDIVQLYLKLPIELRYQVQGLRIILDNCQHMATVDQTAA